MRLLGELLDKKTGQALQVFDHDKVPGIISRRTRSGRRALRRSAACTLVLAALAAAGPASADVRDTSGVLELQPPLSVSVNFTGNPQADLSLASQLVVQICKVTDHGCERVENLSAQSSGLERLRRVGSDYVALWNTQQSHTQIGDRYRFTFRVAGLKIGSAEMKAVSLYSPGMLTASVTLPPLIGLELGLVLPIGGLKPGAFVPGVPVPVVFSVDNHPVVRTRSMHDNGKDAIDIGARLKSEFALPMDDAFTALTFDVREQDLNFDSEPQTAGLFALLNGPLPFDIKSVIEGVTSPGSYGSTAAAAAAAAVGKTLADGTPVFTAQEIVNGLVSASTLPALSNLPAYDPTKPIAGQDPKRRAALDQLLAIATGQLGATSAADKLALLANATNLTTGKAVFNPLEVLTVLRANNLLTDPTTALSVLLDKLPVDDDLVKTALDTVQKSFNLGVVKLTAVSLLVPDLPFVQLRSAIESLPAFAGVFTNGTTLVSDPDQSGPLESITSRAGRLDVVEGCKADAYQRLTRVNNPTLDAGSIPALLGGRHADGVLSPEQVAASLRLLPGSGAGVDDNNGIIGGCGLDALTSAKAIRAVYYEAKPAKDQAFGVAAGLAAPLDGLTPVPVSDLILSVGKALDKELEAGESLHCVATAATSVPFSLGTVTRPRGGAGVALPDVLKTLDSGAAHDVFGPAAGMFGLGANQALDKFGRCLAQLGVKIPLPLRKITVRYLDGYLGSTSLPARNSLMVGRAGWTPKILSGLQDGILRQLNEVKVPAGSLTVSPALKGLTMLPIFAIGPRDFHGSDYAASRVHHDFFVEELLANGAGNPLLNLRRVPNARPGDFTFIVPALPGEMNFEAQVYTNPNALGELACSEWVNDAVVAAYIASPLEQIVKINNTRSDLMFHGGRTLTVPDQPHAQTYTFDLVPEGWVACRITTEGGSMNFDMDVQFLESVTDLTSEVTTRLNGATTHLGAITGHVNGEDVTLPATPGLALIGNLDPVGGNFLSLLAGMGVAPSTVSLNGTALSALMTTGFLPL